MSTDYSYLLDEYPEIISQNQLIVERHRRVEKVLKNYSLEITSELTS